VITSALIADGVREQLPKLSESNLLIEPEGKDTAPAVAWASLEIAKRYGDDTIIGFFPADHWIGNQEAFINTIEVATKFANENPAIVTLGITPNFPSTGYGYIEQGKEQKKVDNLPIYKVTRFTEKPDEITAKNFIKTGLYSWNSGMFVFQAGVVLNELKNYAPEMIKLLENQGKDAYLKLEKISIDYALMEKTELAYIIPADFGWDDLGDWNALERLLKENQDNVIIGNHQGIDTKDSIIYNNNQEEIIVTIGLKDVIIVREGNATLIVNKNCTQDIKKVLKSLQQKENANNFL
jgi:mannose-1-phosphate guanylyltransferase